MNYNNKDLQAKEAQEVRIHKIRIKLISFKEIAAPVLENKAMSYQQFLELSISAAVSSDYNDSLLLNKLTVLYPVPSIQ